MLTYVLKYDFCLKILNNCNRMKGNFRYTIVINVFLVKNKGGIIAIPLIYYLIEKIICCDEDKWKVD